ncbi:3477_t:CDS:2, partial [Acaulospora colombiana]
KIDQKTLDGNVVQIWDSIALAGYTLKISRPHISACCSRKRNIAGGWRWMYYEDYIEQDPNEEWKEIEDISELINIVFIVHPISNGVPRKKTLSMLYTSAFGATVVDVLSNRFSIMALLKNFHPYLKHNV